VKTYYFLFVQFSFSLLLILGAACLFKWYAKAKAPMITLPRKMYLINGFFLPGPLVGSGAPLMPISVAKSSEAGTTVYFGFIVYGFQSLLICLG